MSASKCKVLYVDAFETPSAWQNIKGIKEAYERATVLTCFDYRTLAQTKGKVAMNALLVEKALEVKPDLVHLGKCETVTGDAVRRIKEALLGTTVIHFYGDYRTEVQPWVPDIGRYADWTLFQHKDAGVYRQHLDAGCKRCGFWFEGVDRAVFYPRDVERDLDVVFMATAPPSRWTFHQERWDVIRATAAAGYNIHVFGTGWEKLKGVPLVHLHPFTRLQEYARNCSRAKVALGYSIGSIYLYTSWPRLFNTMGSGAFYLTHYFNGLETLFERGVHLDWFSTIPEMVDKIRYYIDNPKERERIAAAGMREVHEKHTWDHRIAEMLERVR